ncbi:MAG: hypothetical protein OEY29_05010 [Gammaproteobacteria bacterium]|nr:hypothetical protein [Gammaproteobacteria bacterium]
MKAVLIAEKKPAGGFNLSVLILLFSAAVWYLEKYLSLLHLLTDKLKQNTLPASAEYVFIAVCALLLALITHTVIKYIQLKKLKLIIFSVKLAVDESYHYVQAPAAMTSSMFLKLFFKQLMAAANKDKYSKVLKQYKPQLEIRRSDTLMRFNESQTLENGGLKNGDICQIIGKPKSVS